MKFFNKLKEFNTLYLLSPRLFSQFSTPETKGEDGAVNHVLALQLVITDHSKAAVLL